MVLVRFLQAARWSRALLAAAPLLACRAPTPASNEAYLVGSDLDNAPFAWIDQETTEPAGRDVEMMRLIAAEAGLPLAWKRIPFDELLGALEAGEVDLVCATLGVTPERTERVAFTRPYFRTRIVAVVRTGADEPIDLAALAGRPVAAARGTTSERAVRALLPEARLLLDDEERRTTEERLRARAVDAAVMDGPAAEALVARSGAALAILEPALAPEDYAIALTKADAELLAELNAALERLEADGRLAALDRAYGLSR